jgi:transposase-like protein
MKTYTIKDFEKQFPDEATCLDFLFKARYPKGVHCPKCDKITNHYRIANRKVYSCEFCGHHISPTAGTIFHKSETPLKSWFHAMFLMASTKTGISAKQLERELGVTYKTAWRMFTQIRKLMNENVNPLTDEVEVDETYVGGKRRGKRGRGASGKSIVFGMTERNGNAIAKVVPNVKRNTLLPLIMKRLDTPSNCIVYTDELPSYDTVSTLGYGHEVVQHAAKEYVAGNAHVNTCEALWSTIKRGIDGVNHHVSPLYLQGYLDSYLYRYNHRRDETPMFQNLLNRVFSVVEPLS